MPWPRPGKIDFCHSGCVGRVSWLCLCCSGCRLCVVLCLPGTAGPGRGCPLQQSRGVHGVPWWRLVEYTTITFLFYFVYFNYYAWPVYRAKGVSWGCTGSVRCLDLPFFVASSLLCEYPHTWLAHFPESLGLSLSSDMFLSPVLFCVAVLGTVLTNAVGWYVWNKQFCACILACFVPMYVLVWPRGQLAWGLLRGETNGCFACWRITSTNGSLCSC